MKTIIDIDDPVLTELKNKRLTVVGLRGKTRMHSISRWALIALVLLALPGIQKASAAPATAVPAREIEPRALDLLKAATSTLERAKTFSFRTRNTPGAPADSSPFASFFADARFAVMHPDKVRAKVRGEAPPLDVFFDGKTLTVYKRKRCAPQNPPKRNGHRASPAARGFHHHNGGVTFCGVLLSGA